MLQICRNCGLINPGNSQRCDCGYDFVARSTKESYSTGRSPRKQGVERRLMRRGDPGLEIGVRMRPLSRRNQDVAEEVTVDEFRSQLGTLDADDTKMLGPDALNRSWMNLSVPTAVQYVLLLISHFGRTSCSSFTPVALTCVWLSHRRVRFFSSLISFIPMSVTPA